MKQEKKRIFQGTPSTLKPWTYEARLRREKACREKAQIESVAAKLETFASELKADGVRYFIFTDINANCHIKVDCTNEQFAEMLTELASRIQNPFASFLGEQFIAHGLALLKYHNKEAFDIVKRNIAEL